MPHDQPNSFSLNTVFAIIGNGSTAVNLLHALLTEIEAQELPAYQLNFQIHGKGPETDCGTGYAYGEAGAHGHLTEYTTQGAADYEPKKTGAFTAFAHALGFKSATTGVASRAAVGAFHQSRYRACREQAERLGIKLTYHQGEVTDLIPTSTGGYTVQSGNGNYAADYVALALGDVPCPRFNKAAQAFAGEVFTTPYAALDAWSAAPNTAPNSIVAFGTRSSFVDLVNQLKRRGWQGQLIGISTSGVTSWPVTPDSPSYTPRHVTLEKGLLTTQAVLEALNTELASAATQDAYIPEGLAASVALQERTDQPQRLAWTFDPEAERVHAGSVTYHQVAQAIAWEDIRAGLSSDAEREKFDSAFSDFILYNRVNRITREEYEVFADSLASGAVHLRRGSFAPEAIQRNAAGGLTVKLTDGSSIACGAVVNCAVGPAAAQDQVASVSLLKNLAAREILTPRPKGTGFTMAQHLTKSLFLFGAQARTYCFQSIGLETYGRHIVRVVGTLARQLCPTPLAVLAALPALPRRSIEHV